MKLNKAEARQLRQTALFRHSKDSTFDLVKIIAQLTDTTSKMGGTLEEVGARMPRNTALQLTSRLEKTTKEEHDAEIRRFVESINPEVYTSNHLLEYQNVANLLRLCLLSRLLSLTQ